MVHFSYPGSCACTYRSKSSKLPNPFVGVQSETVCTVDSKVFPRIPEWSEPKHTGCVQSHLAGNSYTHKDTHSETNTHYLLK